ncbi:hypothetical protein DY000_02008071 [Brassica cretica]|uniref:Uncharacterized protein n=1 Tax=Brassica cretica TaxID=69181 RepID=A0ABQ7BVT3_BRACR|nr:hypothetical protein DY000_02008071 [Brassica cretica]
MSALAFCLRRSTTLSVITASPPCSPSDETLNQSRKPRETLSGSHVVKGLTTYELAARNDLVLALRARIEAIPDGTAGGPKSTSAWAPSTTSRPDIKFDSDGRFDDDYFQESHESSQFRQEFEMRKIKQAGLDALKNMASDMNEMFIDAVSLRHTVGGFSSPLVQWLGRGGWLYFSGELVFDPKMVFMLAMMMLRNVPACAVCIAFDKELTFKAEVEVRHEALREHHGLSEEDNLGPHDRRASVGALSPQELPLMELVGGGGNKLPLLKLAGNVGGFPPGSNSFYISSKIVLFHSSGCKDLSVADLLKSDGSKAAVKRLSGDYEGHMSASQL